MDTVISLGGSIIVPDKVDTPALNRFASVIMELLKEDAGRRFIVVVGGGAPAREWQTAYRTAALVLGAHEDNVQADWIGIMATRLNAQLVKAVFGGYCTDDVVIDPTANAGNENLFFTGRVLVAAGWKPGFSSDNDAVLLAKRFGVKTVINISNIERVYTSDPKTSAAPEPLDSVSWKEYRRLIGTDSWTPGKSLPFDPIASRNAEEAGIEVICAAGSDMENIRQILCGKPYTGTHIHI
ncbi:MAG: UMP kinase [Spirochaetaceae bacterium]|nr:UMP kinase [Spirochaetaceae bacterium]